MADIYITGTVSMDSTSLLSGTVRHISDNADEFVGVKVSDAINAAKEAKASAESASSSEANSKAGEKASALSESNAKLYADNAAKSASSAGSSSSAAANSAKASSDSADKAAASESAAKISEKNAKQYEADSASSASSAASSEQNAQTYATNASKSELAAGAAKTAAQTAQREAETARDTANGASTTATEQAQEATRQAQTATSQAEAAAADREAADQAKEDAEAARDVATQAAEDAEAKKYIHPTFSAHDSGLYKITVDGNGHVTDAEAVRASDLTALGIGGNSDESAGSATQPVYFDHGAPVPTTHTLGASVPSGAKFTDTTYEAATTSANGLMTSDMVTKLNGIAAEANKYSLPTAGSSLGGVKTTSTVTSTSGLTACPIIGGVPYYKDTNTTYTLSSFGISVAASKINYLSSVTSNVQTQINGKAASNHTHEAVRLLSSTNLSNNGSTSFTDKYGCRLYIVYMFDSSENAWSSMPVASPTLGSQMIMPDPSDYYGFSLSKSGTTVTLKRVGSLQIRYTVDGIV